MSQPIVSVIVPAYNAQKYIEKCVNSILNSSLQELELIVVDDKSDDKTLEILSGISDPRLKIIAKHERGGVSLARNAGINCAIGDYISFVDADDWIDCTMLEKLLNTAKINESDITFCNHYLVFSDRIENACDIGFDITFIGDKVNQYIQMFMLKGKKDYEPYFPIGQPWGTLYKASIILNNNIRFEERMQYKEDVIFNLYIAQHSSTIVRVNEPLYYYNKCNTNSLTTSGLKKGMLPRVEMDIMKRTEFYMKYRVDDELFAEGLFQHTFRSFYRNIVPACVVDANYKRCKEIYISETFQNAFTHLNIKCLNVLEKSIYYLIRYHGLWCYYFALLIYKTVITRGS